MADEHVAIRALEHFAGGPDRPRLRFLFETRDRPGPGYKEGVYSDDVVWIHDYHMIPLGAELRQLGVRNRIGFFLHIPFPPPEIVTAGPDHEWLIDSLFAYDVVGFQTEQDVQHGAETEAIEPLRLRGFQQPSAAFRFRKLR